MSTMLTVRKTMTRELPVRVQRGAAEIGRHRAVLDQVLAGTRDWRAVARRNGVGEAEIARFAPALDRFHG